MNYSMLAFGMPGYPELIVILIIALLLFGRRLPDVMRSMGRGVVEFKKGIRGIEDDIETNSTASEPPKQKIVPPTEET